MLLTVIALLLRLQLGEHHFSSLPSALLGASSEAELLDHSASLFLRTHFTVAVTEFIPINSEELCVSCFCRFG